jgi:hypothetical protein
MTTDDGDVVTIPDETVVGVTAEVAGVVPT